MEPTNHKYMCNYSVPDLNMYKTYPDEVFTRAIYKDGRFINYYVSNYGKVYTMYRNKIMHYFIDDRNYWRVAVIISSCTKVYIGVHFLELMSFCPIKETNIYIPNHKDGNPSNNYLGNLEWMTVSQNTQHALDMGLADCKCDHNSRSILKNDQVHYICKLIELGKTNSEILDILGLGMGPERNRIAAVIRLIRRGQTYLDISKQYNIPGINGRTDYPPEFTFELCKVLSGPYRYTAKELCNMFNVKLEDRKMFLNYVQDVTRRQKDTFITNNFPILNSPIPLDKNDPNYKYYY